jgi:hypothetical protein
LDDPLFKAILLKDAVKMDTVVKFSSGASCYAAHARLRSALRTIKGWNTAVDLLITPKGYGTTLYRTWAVVAVRCKIANCSLINPLKQSKFFFEFFYDIWRKGAL